MRFRGESLTLCRSPKMEERTRMERTGNKNDHVKRLKEEEMAKSIYSKEIGQAQIIN